MSKRKTATIPIKKEDLGRGRVPLPKKVEKIHKHRKDRRTQETKQHLENMAQE
jgi:hypothetical protein